MIRHLERAGFDVVAVSDGLQALRFLGDESFDAVIADAMMPGASGFEVLRAARARDLDLPVLLISGRSDAEASAEAIRYGATEYLVKPFDMSLLESKVKRAVELHQLAKERRQAARLLESVRPEPADRAGLEVTFERALASLWLAYQPIVDASTRAVFGYEALLRSGEPALPHPGAVFDAAERLNRVEEVGRAVRSRAPEPMDSVPPSSLLFVNLHARELDDEMLASPSSPLTGIASRVVLEITERASLDKVKDVRGTMSKLRDVGYRIAIDDLGAGYAGLTSFAQLEPEFVKFDMSLIRDVHKSAIKQKLVRSMAKLCKEMGISVVAEGIEVREERESVIDLGCDLLQGYLFAKPGIAFPEVSW